MGPLLRQGVRSSLPLSIPFFSVPYFLFSFLVMAFTLQANKVHMYNISIRIVINYS